jgi:hypothetical protein
MEINNVTFYFVTHNAEVPSSMSTEKKGSWNELLKAFGSLVKLFFGCYLPIIGFGLFVFGFFATILADPKKDLTGLLSVGFGMLIALSSICFSWVKTIDEKDSKTMTEVKTCGESFLLAAAFLIVSIALKYVSIQFIETKIPFFKFLSKFSYYLFFMILVTVINYFLVAFSKLINVLFLRVDSSIRDI